MSICAGQDNTSSVVSLGSRRPSRSSPSRRMTLITFGRPLRAGIVLYGRQITVAPLSRSLSIRRALRRLTTGLPAVTLEELKRIEEVVSEYGRKNGFSAVTILGRQGVAEGTKGIREGRHALC